MDCFRTYTGLPYLLQIVIFFQHRFFFFLQKPLIFQHFKAFVSYVNLNVNNIEH